VLRFLLSGGVLPARIVSMADKAIPRDQRRRRAGRDDIGWSSARLAIKENLRG